MSETTVVLHPQHQSGVREALEELEGIREIIRHVVGESTSAQGAAPAFV